MYIKIHNDAGDVVGEIAVSAEAQKRARHDFNPSALAYVGTIKALTAGLYTVLKEIEADAGGDEDDVAYQEAFSAATVLQLGAMMAMSAATAHLVK